MEWADFKHTVINDGTSLWKLFYMGIHIDGVYVEPLGIQTPFEIGTLVFLVLHLLVTFTIFVYFVIRRDQFSKNSLKIHILSLIGSSVFWQINQLIYVYADVGPWSHWLHGFIASILILLLFLLQLNIIRAFTRNTTKKLLPRIYAYVPFMIFIWWLITTGSYFVMLPTLGQGFTPLLAMWFRLGFPLFVITVTLYDTAQAIFIIGALWKLMKLKADLMQNQSTWGKETVMTTKASKPSEAKIEGMGRLMAIVFSAIVVDWTAVTVTVLSFYATNVLDATIINVIGGSIAFIHLDLVAFILQSVKRVKITTKTVSSGFLPDTQQRMEIELE
jgi:hypothetical protein